MNASSAQFVRNSIRPLVILLTAGVALALVASAVGGLVGDLLLFALVALFVPSGLSAIGIAFYRLRKRKSRFVHLTPPFTPLAARN